MTVAVETRRGGRGGVPGRRGRSGLLAGDLRAAAAPGVPAAGAFPGFAYQGGPVITWLLVYVSFWGGAGSPEGSQPS